MRNQATFLLAAMAAISSASTLPTYSSCPHGGTVITSARGQITSPNYPSEYPANADCMWKLRSAKGMGIRLRIEYLDNKEVFDGGSGICNDKLQISSHKGDEVSNDKGTELCAKSVNDLKKTEYEFRNSGDDIVIAEIKFTSDFSDHGTGFSIQFESLCNRTQSGYSGTLTSPNYPGNYINNAECFTEINAPVGSTIEINFTSFKVEKQLVCISDYIAVSEGPPGLYGSQPKKYCKDAGVISVKANIATIKFVSDGNLVHPGYTATWKAIFPTTASPTTTVETTTLEMKNCSYTNESILCQRWDSTSPHKPKYVPDDNNHNFCRNPDNDGRGPWCYTMDKDTRWGYCDLDNCVAPTTTEPTTTSASSAAKTTTEAETSTNISDSIVAVYVGNVTPDKQVSDNESSAIPWFIYVIIGVAFLAVIIVVLVFVCRRRRRRRKSAMTVIESSEADTVAFHQLERDEYGERPRENTYVEIPFLGEVNSAARNKEEESQDSCGKNFIRLGDRESKNSSVSSQDSILNAKEAAQRRFASETRGASTSDANPYSVADELSTPPLPKNRSEKSMRVAIPEPNDVNVYHSIGMSQQQNKGNIFAGAPLPPTPIENSITPPKKESSKKKSEWNLKKKSSKSNPIPTTGFSNPSYREKEDPQGVDSAGENPFDTDDEAMPEVNSTYNVPPSTAPKGDENIYNALSVIPTLTEEDQQKDSVNDKKSYPSADSPYMMPKLAKTSQLPKDVTMLVMSPDIIDDKEETKGFENDFNLYSSPNPTSPVFDLAENFNYAIPRDVRPAANSMSSKSDSDSGQAELSRDSSTKSDRDSGNASLSAIESIADDQNHGEYCTMSSVPRPAKRNSKSTSDENTENRLSQLYLSMKGIESDRRVSESSWKSLQKETPKPRKSL